MKGNNYFDHIKTGKVMRHFVYPPYKLPEISGFEGCLAETSAEKVKDLLVRCEDLKRQRDGRIKQIKQLNKPGSIEEFWLKAIASVEFAEYFVVKKWLSYWTKIWRLACHAPRAKKFMSQNLIGETEIERARQKSIEELYEGKLRKVGSRLMGLCPFHEEKTASFCVFPNNRFYCFGCSENGDSIKFAMKIYNLDFIEVVRRLAT